MLLSLVLPREKLHRLAALNMDNSSPTTVVSGR